MANNSNLFPTNNNAPANAAPIDLNNLLQQLNTLGYDANSLGQSFKNVQNNTSQFNNHLQNSIRLQQESVSEARKQNNSIDSINTTNSRVQPTQQAINNNSNTNFNNTNIQPRVDDVSWGKSIPREIRNNEYISTKSSTRPTIGGDTGRIMGDDLNKNLQQFGHMINPASFAQYAVMFGAAFPAQMAMAGAMTSPVTETAGQFDKIKSFSGGITGIKDALDGFGSHLQQSPFKMYEGMYQSKIMLSSALGGEKQSNEAVKTALRLAKEYPVRSDQVLSSLTRLAVYPEVKPNLKDEGFQRKLMETVSGLSLIVPEQGMEGAMFSLVEAMSGSLRSMQMRFNVSPEVVESMAGMSKQEMSSDPNKLVSGLHSFVSKAVGLDVLDKQKYTFSKQVDNFGDSLQMLVKEVFETTGLYKTITGGATAFQTGFSSLATNKEFLNFTGTLTKPFQGKVDNAMSKFTGIPLGLYQSSSISDMSKMAEENFKNLSMDEIGDRFGNLINDMGGALRDATKSINTILNNQFGKTLGDIASDIGDVAATNFTQMASGVISAAAKSLVTDPTMLLGGAGMMATIGAPMFAMQMGTNMLQQSLQNRPISQRVTKGVNSMLGYDTVSDKIDDINMKSNAYNSGTAGGTKFTPNLTGKQLQSTLGNLNNKSIAALDMERTNFMTETDTNPKRLWTFVNNSIRGSNYSSLGAGDNIFDIANKNSQATIKAMMGGDFAKFQEAGFTDNQIYKMQANRLAINAQGMERDIYESTGEKLSTKKHGTKFASNAARTEYNYGVGDKNNSLIKRVYGKNLNALGGEFKGSGIEKQMKNDIATQDRFAKYTDKQFTNFAPDMEGGGYSPKKAKAMQAFLKGELFGKDTAVISKLTAKSGSFNTSLTGNTKFSAAESKSIFEVADKDAGLAKFMADNNIANSGNNQLSAKQSNLVRTYINKMGVKNPSLLNAMTTATGTNNSSLYSKLNSNITSTTAGADYSTLHAADKVTGTLRETLGQINDSVKGGTVTSRTSASAFFDQRSPNKQLTDLINATKNNGKIQKLLSSTDMSISPSVRSSKLQSSALFNKLDDLKNLKITVGLPSEFANIKLANAGRDVNVSQAMLSNTDWQDVYSPKATMSRAEKLAELATDTSPKAASRLKGFRLAEEVQMSISHTGRSATATNFVRGLFGKAPVGEASSAYTATTNALRSAGGEVGKFKVGSVGNSIATTNEFFTSLKNTSGMVNKFGKIFGGLLQMADVPLIGMQAYSTAKEAGAGGMASKVIGVGAGIGTLGVMQGLSAGKGLMHGAMRGMPLFSMAYAGLDALQGNMEGKNKINKKEADVEYRRAMGDFADADMSSFVTLNASKSDRHKAGMSGIKDNILSTSLMAGGAGVGGFMAAGALGMAALPLALGVGAVVGAGSLYANYQRGRGDYTEREKETLGNVSGFSAQSKMYKERSFEKQRDIDNIEANSVGGLTSETNNRLINLKRAKSVDIELQKITGQAANMSSNIGDTRGSNIESRLDEEAAKDTLMPSTRTLGNIAKLLPPMLIQRGANAVSRTFAGDDAPQFDVGNYLYAATGIITQRSKEDAAINPISYTEDKGATSASRLLNYTQSANVMSMNPNEKMSAYIATSASLATVNKEFQDDLGKYAEESISPKEKSKGVYDRIAKNKEVNESVRGLQRDAIDGIDFNDTAKVEVMKQVATSRYNMAPIPLGNQGMLAEYKKQNVGTLIQDNVEAQLLSSVATNDNMRNYYSAIDTGSATNLSQMGIDNPIDLIVKKEERQKYIDRQARSTYSKDVNGKAIDQPKSIEMATADYNNVFKNTLSALGSVGTKEGSKQFKQMKIKNDSMRNVFTNMGGESAWQGGMGIDIQSNLTKQSTALKSLKEMSISGSGNDIVSKINAVLSPADKISSVEDISKLSDTNIQKLSESDEFTSSLSAGSLSAFKNLTESTVKLNAVFSKSAQSTSQTVAQSNESIQKFGEMLRVGAISNSEYDQNVLAAKADANNSITALKASGADSQDMARQKFEEVTNNNDLLKRMGAAGINSANDLTTIDSQGKSGLDRLKKADPGIFDDVAVAKKLEDSYSMNKSGKSDIASANYEGYQLKMNEAKQSISETSAGSQYTGTAMKLAQGSLKNKDRLIKDSVGNLKSAMEELQGATSIDQYDAAKSKIDAQNSMLDQLGVNSTKRAVGVGKELYEDTATSMADSAIYGNKFTERGQINAAAVDLEKQSRVQPGNEKYDKMPRTYFKDENSGKYYDYEGATYANAHKSKGHENDKDIDIPQNIKDEFARRTKGKVTDNSIISGEAPGKLNTADMAGTVINRPVDTSKILDQSKCDSQNMVPPQCVAGAGATSNQTTPSGISSAFTNLKNSAISLGSTLSNKQPATPEVTNQLQGDNKQPVTPTDTKQPAATDTDNVKTPPTQDVGTEIKTSIGTLGPLLKTPPKQEDDTKQLPGDKQSDSFKVLKSVQPPPAAEVTNQLSSDNVTQPPMVDNITQPPATSEVTNQLSSDNVTQPPMATEAISQSTNQLPGDKQNDSFKVLKSVPPPSNIAPINSDVTKFSKDINKTYTDIGNNAYKANVSLLNNINTNHDAQQQEKVYTGITQQQPDISTVGGNNATANQNPSDFVRNLISDVLPALVGTMSPPQNAQESNFSTNGM